MEVSCHARRDCPMAEVSPSSCELNSELHAKEFALFVCMDSAKPFIQLRRHLVGEGHAPWLALRIKLFEEVLAERKASR